MSEEKTIGSIHKKINEICNLCDDINQQVIELRGANNLISGEASLRKDLKEVLPEKDKEPETIYEKLDRVISRLHQIDQDFKEEMNRMKQAV